MLPRTDSSGAGTTMRIVQISDTHISRDHPARANELAACIQFINRMDPAPDVVVHTGDVAHDGLAEEYAIARRLLGDLTAPCFVIPGNRDNRLELIKAFADGQHIRSGMEFIQYSIERPDVRLICIDTVSTTSNKGRLCEARLAHAERMLSADASRPSLLFLHHPPFQIGTIPDPFQYEDWTAVDAFGALLARHRQVRAVICGHVHRNVQASIGSVSASTVSCVAPDLRKGKASGPRHELAIFSSVDFS
jgi:3',5'-cyclic AMP phosphodiesterase CpdA